MDRVYRPNADTREQMNTVDVFIRSKNPDEYLNMPARVSKQITRGGMDLREVMEWRGYTGRMRTRVSKQTP